jgi:twinkle protein
MSAPFYSPLEINQSIARYYREGMKRGDSTGFVGLDEFFTVAPKQVTVVTGIPGMGKSELVDQLMVKLAEGGPWTFAMYSPENFPVEMHAAKLLEKHVGAPFADGPTMRMEPPDGEAMDWIHEHFIWLKPEYPNPLAILEDAAKFRPANKKFGVLLDPWSSLEHLCPKGLSETQYIGKTLTEASRWVREHDAHLFIVAHPMKLAKDIDNKRPVPTPYDISGSANWFNLPDNILAVHRDKQVKGSPVSVFVHKVRFKWIGGVGEAKLRYDYITGRYWDDDPVKPQWEREAREF